MTGKFREVWRGLHTDAAVHRTVTLASLVEKEGKLAGERPVIASVFARRLAIGMKLDCDPTTIYAALLAGNYRGAIHRSDLASGDPYNTYRTRGCRRARSPIRVWRPSRRSCTPPTRIICISWRARMAPAATTSPAIW